MTAPVNYSSLQTGQGSRPLTRESGKQPTSPLPPPHSQSSQYHQYWNGPTQHPSARVPVGHKEVATHMAAHQANQPLPPAQGQRRQEDPSEHVPVGRREPLAQAAAHNPPAEPTVVPAFRNENRAHAPVGAGRFSSKQ